MKTKALKEFFQVEWITFGRVWVSFQLDWPGVEIPDLVRHMFIAKRTAAFDIMDGNGTYGDDIQMHITDSGFTASLRFVGDLASVTIPWEAVIAVRSGDDKRFSLVEESEPKLAAKPIKSRATKVSFLRVIDGGKKPKRRSTSPKGGPFDGPKRAG